MFNKHTTLLLIIYLCTIPSVAQNKFVWDDFVEEITSSQESESEEHILSYLEELKDLHEHPININTATIEELEQQGIQTFGPYAADDFFGQSLYHYWIHFFLVLLPLHYFLILIILFLLNN